MGSSLNKELLFKKYLGMRLLFLTIPKSLKQYTLFQKRLSIPLSSGLEAEPEADK